MKRILVILALICWTPALLLLVPVSAPAADIVWDGSEDSDWSNVDNWTPADVPDPDDVAHFDGVSDVNCTLDESTEVLGIQLDTGYTGTLDLGDSNYQILIGASGFIDEHDGNTDLGDARIGISGGPLDYEVAEQGGTWTAGTSHITLSGACTVTGHYSFELYDLTTATGSTVTIDSGTDSRVEVANVCTINGLVVLDKRLGVGSNGDFVLNSGASFSGTSNLYLYKPNSGHGLITLNAAVTVGNVFIDRSLAGARLAAGTYGGLVTLYATGSDDSLLELDNDTYDFDGGLTLQNAGTGLVTLCNKTNDPTINVTTITVDLDSTGNILIDDDGVEVDWNVSGNIVDEETGGGSFTWTQGTGTKSFVGTADQAIDSGGRPIGTWGIDKQTSGKVSIVGTWLNSLGPVDMVGDGSVALEATGTHIESTADAKNFVGASANAADVSFSDASNDVDLGSAVWTVENGDFDYTSCGTFADATSTLVMKGTGNLSFKDQEPLYNLTSFLAGTTTIPAGSGTNCQIANQLVVNGTISVAADRLAPLTTCTMSMGSAGSVTGNGTLWFAQPQGNGGLTTFTTGASIDVANVAIVAPLATGVFVGATWDCGTLFKVTNTAAATKVWDPSGTQTFRCPFEAENTNAGGTLQIDGSNNPSWVFTDDVTWTDTAGTLEWTNVGTGTITGSSIAKLGGSFRFNGVSDEVDINAQLHDFSTDFTVAAWIRLPTVTGTTDRCIFSQGANCQFYVIADGRLNCKTNADNTYTGSGVFTADTWHHVMVTYDDSGVDVVKVYVDNVEEATENKTAANTAADSRIGSYLGSQEWFRGHIDDVRVYDKALSTAERAALYNSGDGTTDAVASGNCLAWYKLDEQAANITVADSKGTNTGTATQNTNVMSATPAAWDFGGETIEDIEIDTSHGTLTMGGGFTADSFTFIDGSLDLNEQTVITTGNFSVAAGCTFATGGAGLNGATLTVGGDFTVTGTSAGSLMDMTAASGWTLTVSGMPIVKWADVAHSDASGGNTIRGTGCTNSGNNQNWRYSIIPIYRHHYRRR